MERKPSKQFFATEGAPRMFDILKCTVSRIQPYGVFVKIPGCRKDGLVHKSQISQTKVEDPSEVLGVGEEVYCKVISVEAEGSKIGLAMKLVNQTTGKDLDPNNVQSSLDAQKRKQGFKKETPKIELDAVFNTTCKKCGGKGHLAQDCFHQAGGASYELLPEMDDLMKSAQAETSQKSTEKKREHKHKKEKKKKKRRHKSTSSESDDEKEKRKKKKHRKRTRRKSYDTDDSRGSDEKKPRYRKKGQSRRRSKSSSESSDTNSDGHDTRKRRRLTSSEPSHHRKRHKTWHK